MHFRPRQSRSGTRGRRSPAGGGRGPAEARLKTPRRIGILGHVGNGNLGDEAIIDALLRGVREAVPDAEFTAFTVRPADTEARHGIRAFPLRRGADAVRTAPPAVAAVEPRPTSSARSTLRRIPGLGFLLSRAAAASRRLVDWSREASFWVVRWRRMRGVDLLIVAGSNQLSDYYGGAWGFPYTLWAWSLAARLAGARVAYLSVGAGPIRERRSGAILRAALSLADYRSYRDVGSCEAIAAIGFPGPLVRAPDLAHGLRIAPASGPASDAGVGAGMLVAINPLPYFDPRSWAERDAAVYSAFVETMAGFAKALLARGDRVRFVPTQLRADPQVIADILRAMGPAADGATAESLAPAVTDFDDLVAQLTAADFIVATRFHGVLISQMLGKPTIGIVYRRSTRDLLVDVGQGDYAVDIREITPALLLERLAALSRDGGAKDRIQRRLEEYRKDLRAQYATLLGIAPHASSRET
ncbi:MAG TPA: polysaccharide pyruvyl transferase family protein [Candidatus Eisenbacteria bacterium]|nr:polysaccharide pyruvyl transferase family protein [Candidatus Eisenbacteria bacterium]